jgi:type II secretory pathway pseudopilin PulG
MSTKRTAIFNQGRGTQYGAVLMIMLVIMIVGIAAILVNSLSSATLKNARQKNTADALAQAKDALIGFAVTYADTHSGQVSGYLPCPDPNGTAGVNGEGSSETCGSKNVSAIGRLPWKTLGLSPLRDGNGECLWYAVAGTYKNNPMTDMMNWDTNGLLNILDASGTIIAQNVVAVVFAPGSVLGNQDRSADGSAPTCGGNYTAGNYLDSDGTINNASVSGTANAIRQFRLVASSQINDQMIFITRQDIWNAIKKRNDFGTFVTNLLQPSIAYLPTTVDFSTTPTTENSYYNRWLP